MSIEVLRVVAIRYNEAQANDEEIMSAAERPFTVLADLVRHARQARSLTQRELSRALGRSEGYVGHLESGRFRPTVETLKTLATVLELLYGRLAIEAGYITPEEFENPIDERQLARLNEIGELTDDEWESVKDFARYVLSRRGGEE